MKPVPEMQFLGFSYPAFEQIINHAARLRARSCGQYSCQMVIRTPYGGGISAPEHHSESTETFFAHYPGLKVVVPSTPYDTKGLLTSAIRDPDPVVFLEPARLYRGFKDEVPEVLHRPDRRRSSPSRGSDVSVFTWGSMTRRRSRPPRTSRTRYRSRSSNFDRCPRSIRRRSSSRSKDRTERRRSRSPKSVGLGAEVTARIQEEALLYLEAPIERVTGFDVPFPLYSLEEFYLPRRRASRTASEQSRSSDMVRNSNYRTSARVLQRANWLAGWSKRATRFRKTSRSPRSRRTRRWLTFPPVDGTIRELRYEEAT